MTNSYYSRPSRPLLGTQGISKVHTPHIPHTQAIDSFLKPLIGQLGHSFLIWNIKLAIKWSRKSAERKSFNDPRPLYTVSLETEVNVGSAQPSTIIWP